MRHCSLTPIVIAVVVLGFHPALHAQALLTPTGNVGSEFLHQTAFTALRSPDHDTAQPANDGHVHVEDQVDTEGHLCDHCYGHDHGHGYDDHDLDYLQPFHHRHETQDGYPIFEVLRTDHAFIERKIRADFVHSANADGGEVHESEFEFELFWAINNRMAWVVEFPVILLDPRNDPSTSGIGDLEAGFRFVAFDGQYDIVTFGLNVTTPTGDPDRGLGAGHTSLEPKFLWWHDIGCGWVLQSEAAWEIPIDVDESENEMRYNVALCKTLLGTCDWPVFTYLTPLIEVNGITTLNGDASGATVIDLTPGFRWAVTEQDHAGFGFSIPVTNERNFSSRFIFSYIRHF